jgi:hypothetical protein
MWLINWLPNWVFYTTLLAGVIFAVGATITNMRTLQLVAAAIAVLAALQVGGIETNTKWQTRVDEMQARVALAEQKSATANKEIVTKTVTKIQLVKQTTDANTEYITRYVAQDLDSECKLTATSILLHNSASKGEVSRSTTDINGTTTEVKASELLTTVVENYGTYYELVEKLQGWQDWYYKQKKIFEE